MTFSGLEGNFQNYEESLPSETPLGINDTKKYKITAVQTAFLLEALSIFQPQRNKLSHSCNFRYLNLVIEW